MLSAGDNVKLDLKIFSGASPYPPSTKEQPLSEEQKRAELRARTGFDRTPAERFFYEIFSLKSAKTGVAVGSAGLFGCGSSLGSSPNPNNDGMGTEETSPDAGIDAPSSPDASRTDGSENFPPTILPISDQEVREGELLEFEVSFYDPDGQKLTVVAQGLPSGASFDDDIFSWRPDFDQAGVYEIIFSVADGETVVEQTVTITVLDVNRPPLLDRIDDQEANEGGTLEFVVSSSDPDGDETSVTSLIPAGAFFDGTLFSWTPNYEQAGVYEATFVASDGDLSASQAVNITVNNVNRPPVLEPITDQSVDEGDALRFAVSASDPDGDSVEITAEGLPEGASFDGTTFSWTPGFERAGSYEVTFVASDGEMTTFQTVFITVNNANRAPLLDPIPDQVVDENERLVFTISASDADRDSVVVSTEGLPAGATFDGTIFSWTPGFEQAGSYEVTFIASDGELISRQAVSITVNNVNRTPVLEPITDQSVDEGEELRFAVFAGDPDGDGVEVTAGDLPEGASFDGGTFIWRPGFEQAGSYEVTFVANDGEFISIQVVNITVNGVNRPPLLNPIANQEIDEEELFELALDGSDPDGDGLIYSAALVSGGPLPEGVRFDSITGVLNWTPSCLQSGAYRINFTVTDDGEPRLSTSREMEVAVIDSCLWTQTHNGPNNGNDYGFAIAVDLSSNVYVTGSSGDYIWTRKYDSDGNEIWTRTHNGSGSGFDSGRGIAVDQSGNVYVTGGEFVTGLNSDIWTRKYDSDGNEIWTRTHNGSSNGFDIGYGIAVDLSSNVYVTGSEMITGQYYNIWTRKYDSDGNEIWTRTHNGPGNRNDAGRGIAVDQSGDVYVTGFESITDPSGRNNNDDIWTRKYDSDGNEIWTRTHDGPPSYFDRGNGIAVDLSDNIYVTGSEMSENQDDGNIWTRKYDSDGNEIWTRTHIGLANYHDGGNGIAVDLSGNIYVTGFETANRPSTDIWTRKYDSEGNEIWTQVYNDPSNRYDIGYGIAVDQSGAVYVVGSEQITAQFDNIWIRKYRNAP